MGKGINQLPIVAEISAEQLPKAGGLVPGILQLIQTVVASGSPATVTFSSIPQIYRNLRVMIEAQDTKTTSTGLAIKLQVNGDSTAGNYGSSQYLQASGGTVLAGAITGASTGGEIGGVPGTSGNANAVGIIDISIPNYSGTTFYKIMQSQTMMMFGGTPTLQLTMYAFAWHSTAAITSLTFTAAGTAFATGSTFSLYGMG